MKRIGLFIIGTTAYYLLTVLTLYLLKLVFEDSFDNIWVAAVPVTVIAELLLFVWHLRTKRRCKS